MERFIPQNNIEKSTCPKILVSFDAEWVEIWYLQCIFSPFYHTLHKHVEIWGDFRALNM